MKIPSLLIKGDTVAIAATARKVSIDEMQDAISLLEEWGLNVLVQPELFAAENQFAGTDVHRAMAFSKLLANPKVKAIFCARGGYGTIRMVDLIDFSPLSTQPKWIIGYSDITVLIGHLFQTQQLCTLHGPMPLNMQASKQHVQSLQQLKHTLFKGPQSIWFEPNPYNSFDVNSNDAYPIIGGNLSVLYSMLGSNSFPLLNNCYLFLEDLDEYLYHIDRMMQGLKRAGVFKCIKGILVGDMSDMKDNAIPFGKNAYEIILETAVSLQIPVLFGVPAGHEPHNESIVMGYTYQISQVNGKFGLLPVKNTI
jgi:muramoyltetrapeptide carboxypeptidase